MMLHRATELPVGYRDRSGRVHRHVELRKMTGADEDLLYDGGLNPGQLVTSLLAATIVKLGEIAHVDRHLVGDLYVADRNHLLLELRRHTLGESLTASYTCSHCGAGFNIRESLADIPVRRLAADEPVDTVVVDLADGYEDEGGQRHRRVELGPPRGNDEEFVGAFALQQPLRARDALLLRCIRKFGDLAQASLDGFGVELLRALTLGDRRLLSRSLNELTFGPDFRRRVTCKGCGGDFDALLDASHFFVDG